MVISSRTPEGRPNHCPVWGAQLRIDPSDPPGDAPCPRCGHLLWFIWEDLGNVQVLRPTGEVLDAALLDKMTRTLVIPSGTRLVVDLSEVRFISSDALGKLIQLARQDGRPGRRLCLHHLDPVLSDVFRITRLDELFDLAT